MPLKFSVRSSRWGDSAPFEDGAKLLNELSTRSQHILVSVPVWHPEQDAMHGNVLQEHHAQYDVPKLRELGFRQIWRVSGNYIALHSATTRKSLFIL